ncbi:MAG: peptidase [Chthoniobacteraceae bacterium]|nr:peptidase [Chthoniobacteraceae bacterium]
MSKSTWFKITNAASKDEEAEISIYDVIGSWGVTAASFCAQLKAITASKINLRIHCPGGAIFEGAAIANAIERHPATVTAHIDGLAASMATVIAMSADKVCMAKNAMFMIHNPAGYVGGDAEDMRSIADLLDTLKETILNAYEQKTGKDRGDLSNMMDKETWLTAEEALEDGFIDEITEDVKAAACITGDFDLSGFLHAPSVDTATHGMPKKPTTLPEALTALEASQNRVGVLEPLTGQVSTLNAQLVTANGTITAHAGSISALTIERDTFKAERDTANGAIVTLRAEIATLKNTAKTASELAVDIVAETGAPAVSAEKNPSADAKLSGSVLLAAYEAIKDPEARTAFFAKNKAAIFAAYNSKR